MTAPMPTNRQVVENARHQKLRMRMIVLSLTVGLGLMAVKFYTYHMTHSSAVLSDALESIINVVASAFATVSVWMSAKPPDPEHPYGHGKIEYFSAGFEGALIVCAAIGIFYTGIRHLFIPHPLPYLEQGAVILIAATLVNLLLGLGLLHTGKRTESITLVADGRHIITDVYTSAGVVIGLVLVHWTGWLWLDGAIACLVGINILITGGKLVRQSAARLMDASDPRLLDEIAAALQRFRRPQWIDIHQLRAWRAGHHIYIDLHLVLPDALSLDQAHDEAHGLETMLESHFNGRASVLVHMDPCSATHCPDCADSDCQRRDTDQAVPARWNQDHLIRARRKKGP